MSSQSDRAVRVVLLSLVLLCANATAAACDDKLGGYVQPRLDDSDTVIVFVHGLKGHPWETWFHPGAPMSWPCMLRQDPAFKDANLYLYGYPTDFVGKQPSIAEVAEAAQQDLLPVLKAHDQAIFVVHSMGGLVVAQALMSLGSEMANRELLRRVKLVSFFGTPGGGAALARAEKLLPLSLQVKELSGGSLLDGIVERWNQSPLLSERSRCLAESEPLGAGGSSVLAHLTAMAWSGLKGWFGADTGVVVPEASAGAMCGNKVRTLSGTDHSTLVKPMDTQHVSMHHFARHAQYCARPARSRHGQTQAGKPEARSALGWRERFAAGIAVGNSAARESHVLQFMAQAGGAMLSTYIVPPDPTGPRAWQVGELNATHFGQWLREQPIVAEGQKQHDVALAKDVNAIVIDGGARARVHELRSGGVLLDEDVIALVDDPASTDGGLLLLLLAADVKSSDSALKGLLRIEGLPRCAH